MTTNTQTPKVFSISGISFAFYKRPLKIPSPILKFLAYFPALFTIFWVTKKPFKPNMKTAVSNMVIPPWVLVSQYVRSPVFLSVFLSKTTKCLFFSKNRIRPFTFNLTLDTTEKRRMFPVFINFVLSFTLLALQSNHAIFTRKGHTLSRMCPPLVLS